MAGGFAQNTREKFVRLPAMVKPAAGGTTEIQLPSTGLLGSLWLRITATTAGVPAAPNPLGASSIIRRVRLIANTGLELFSVSGPGYGYMLQHLLESEYFPITPQNQYNAAVADAQTYNLDMVIPVTVSMANFTGLVLLQSKQIQLTLAIDWETDANVGGGVLTYTATATPYMRFFTIPSLPEDRPPLNRAHVILEEQRVVSGAGQLIYEPLQTPTYLQIAHGSGFGVAGADNFTTIQLRVEQSNYLFDGDLQAMDMLWRAYHNSARPAGVFAYDFMASSGMGNYGGARDRVRTANITSFESVLQMAGAGQLTTIRRMLIDVS